MQDPTSDLTFRPHPLEPRPPGDDAWEALVREELAKLRRRQPSVPRVVPAARPRPGEEPPGAAAGGLSGAPEEPPAPPPAA